MRRSVQILFFLMLLPLMSCKSKDPNPELSDKIYQDLKQTTASLQSQVESEKSEKEEAYQKLQAAAPQTIDLQEAKMNLKKHSDKLVTLEQKLEYYQIRTERRRVEVRAAYDEAFDQGTTWSGDGDYSAYLVNKRLRNAPRIWNDHVKERTPASAPKTEAPKE